MSRSTDGSGLTRRNKLTPRALATTLQKVKKEDWWPQFYASLPVAGNHRRMVGGTLRYRMDDDALREKQRPRKNRHAHRRDRAERIRDRPQRADAMCTR